MYTHQDRNEVTVEWADQDEMVTVFTNTTTPEIRDRVMSFHQWEEGCRIYIPLEYTRIVTVSQVEGSE